MHYVLGTCRLPVYPNLCVSHLLRLAFTLLPHDHASYSLCTSRMRQPQLTSSLGWSLRRGHAGTRSPAYYYSISALRSPAAFFLLFHLPACSMTTSCLRRARVRGVVHATFVLIHSGIQLYHHHHRRKDAAVHTPGILLVYDALHWYQTIQANVW